RLAKAISDAGFGKLRQQLEYKCAQRGKKLTVIKRFEPTSKKCSHCGHVKTKLALSERTYICEACGMVMDRDLNAAINILAAGSASEAENGRGESARPALPADLCEASTRQSLELSLATGHEN
ncbi:RNA-guided endonuclease InsQ/TnpB family protein, partial [Dubosiella newyorkensis]|uniref:RNA-guided endonuclease InsQ/TnpB family protein n=1 Tax=Dubosiella newyorkensis TaxID=1862672 RepID=UPI0025A62FC1